MKVLFTLHARRQFETAAAWWRLNRETAPFLLEEEVDQAVKLLAGAPFAGTPGRDVRMKDVRRLVLRATRYLIYYRVTESKHLVEILRFWHASRGREPRL